MKQKIIGILLLTFVCVCRAAAADTGIAVIDMRKVFQ